MRVIICGAGEVGSHTAEVLARAGKHITVIDRAADRLRNVEDTMDVRTLRGNAADAAVLKNAGVGEADMVIATTDSDEVNLVAATVAKGLGARKCIARVHHAAYFHESATDYESLFGIDRLICPEYSTAQAIAQTLRNPGAIAIENFARGRIEMQELPVSDDAPTVGRTLAELALPEGTRLAAITHEGETFTPKAETVVNAGDNVILVGNRDVFPQARALFHNRDRGRRRVAIMGGPAMSVWLCRALHNRDFAIRVFESDRERALELAEKLDWVTVLQADPTDQAVFDEESLSQIDTFVALTDDDEHNILGCAWAKNLGVKRVITVLQHYRYQHLLSSINIDNWFSPRLVAVREIESILDESPLRRMATLAEEAVYVYRVRVHATAEAIGKALRAMPLSAHLVVAAIQRADDVRVPGAEDVVERGDTLLVIGRKGLEHKLNHFFGAR
ncbi:MAG: Trk system potassium transporter TrkA [Phycisphaerales bacterium]|nr:Trk system potassium transporter TrkA [Phycisphaerales bacterium]